MTCSDHDPNDFAWDYDGVRGMAARTDPRIFRCRAVRPPVFYQDIRLAVTTDALGFDRLRIPDVHGAVYTHYQVTTSAVRWCPLGVRGILCGDDGAIDAFVRAQ
jgi:hypothetical protein